MPRDMCGTQMTVLWSVWIPGTVVLSPTKPSSAHSPSSRQVRAGAQGKNLEAGAEAEAVVDAVYCRAS